jgi:hypothetical protein
MNQVSAYGPLAWDMGFCAFGALENGLTLGIGVPPMQKASEVEDPGHRPPLGW